MSKKADCLNCAIRGYSPEVCSLHLRTAMCNGGGDEFDCVDGIPVAPRKKKDAKFTRSLAAGACVGVLTSAVGIGAAVAIGVKGVLEAVIAAKLMAGMGIAGAATSAALKNKDSHAKSGKTAKHSGYSVPTLYVKEG
jgi:hypothetical protein